MAQFKKGRAKTGGRRKGVKNKSTVALREALLRSFDRAGGEDYLFSLSQTDAKTYAKLISKLIPTKLENETGGPLVIIKDFTGKDSEGTSS